MRMKHHHSSVICHSALMQGHTHICASLKCYAAVQDPLLNQRGPPPHHPVTITLHHHHHPVGQPTSF